MKLESKVADFFIKHKLTKVLLALSGGVDSVVCLHLLAKLKTINSDFNLRVIHVQHNLQPDSSAWAEFCRNLCQQLDLSLIVESVEVKGCSEIGVEAAARAARYDAFANNLQQGECLVTAQHLDDQAETFLLQSLRGSGVAGLSAMPALKQFASGLQARPLLSVSRSSIQAYADDNKLQWVEDPSNQDPNFARNAIRHAVLPELKKIRSGAAQTLSRVAENCAAANECLQDLAEIDFKNITTSNYLLDIEKLKLLSRARCNNLVRYVCAKLKLDIPLDAHLQQIESILSCKSSAMPCVRWGNSEARCFKNLLYLQHKFEPQAEFNIPWQQGELLILPTGEKLYSESYPFINWQKQVVVRNRVGGEIVRLANGKTCKLKEIWSEIGVPPWLRGQIPLIIEDDVVIVVVGFSALTIDSCPA